MSEKPTSEKYWNELDQDNNRHFYRLLADRADDFLELANSARTELAKYLFAANTGAAAGLFVLLRSAQQPRPYLVAFFCFCAGTFLVGVAYFFFASWTRVISEGWTEDFNRLGRSEISFGELDENNRLRLRSWKVKLARYGLIISFALLIIGGITAVKPFWANPSPEVEHKERVLTQKPQTDVVPPQR